MCEWIDLFDVWSLPSVFILFTKKSEKWAWQQKTINGIHQFASWMHEVTLLQLAWVLIKPMIIEQGATTASAMR